MTGPRAEFAMWMGEVKVESGMREASKKSDPFLDARADERDVKREGLPVASGEAIFNPWKGRVWKNHMHRVAAKGIGR